MSKSKTHLRIVSVQDAFNEHKVMQYKRSKCGHYYTRQLICGNPNRPWERMLKSSMEYIQNNYSASLKPQFQVRITL